MWLFTRHGFYSAVSALQGKKVDRSRVVVRARIRIHLVNLCEAFHVLPDQRKITSSEQSDYRYRLVVPADVWAQVVHDLACDIDYPNFKDACPDEEYHELLVRVWSAGYSAQQREKTQDAYPNLEGSSPRSPRTPGRRPKL